MVDAIAGPVQWCAIWQVALVSHYYISPESSPKKDITLRKESAFYDSMVTEAMNLRMQDQRQTRKEEAENKLALLGANLKILESKIVQETHIVQEFVVSIGILLHGVAE